MLWEIRQTKEFQVYQRWMRIGLLACVRECAFLYTIPHCNIVPATDVSRHVKYLFVRWKCGMILLKRKWCIIRTFGGLFALYLPTLPPTHFISSNNITTAIRVHSRCILLFLLQMLKKSSEFGGGEPFFSLVSWLSAPRCFFYLRQAGKDLRLSKLRVSHAYKWLKM